MQHINLSVCYCFEGEGSSNNAAGSSSSSNSRSNKNRNENDHLLGSESPISSSTSSSISKKLTEANDLSLNHLQILGTIGYGNSCWVQLVSIKNNTERTFALKKCRKQFYTANNRQAIILNEKALMADAVHPFIVKLYRTFKDSKHLYFLMEACLGADLLTIMKKQRYGQFSNTAAEFYTACTIEALTFLHSCGIVFRNVSPENMLIDSTGYCKLGDFSFAKQIGQIGKTGTFTGSICYLAPEMILNQSYGLSVDLWALGITIFQLISGFVPFPIEEDVLETLEKIVDGLDVSAFPRQIEENAKSFILQLCSYNPTQRIGAGKKGIKELKDHLWFHGFDWSSLRDKCMTPPIIPKVKSPSDLSNFIEYEEIYDETVPDDFSKWVIDF